MSATAFAELAAALRDQRGSIERWLDAYERSTIRVPRSIDRAALGQLVAPIVESLRDALSPSPRPGGPPGAAHLIAGSAELREVEKTAALVGAAMATDGTTGFELSALMFALRAMVVDATAGPAQAESRAFAEWLAAVALDAFANAGVAAERERWSEQLEEGTPVLMVAPEVPAAFLIGRSNDRLLDALFGRLILLVVRSGARGIVIDTSGLAQPGHGVALAAFDRFLAHPKVTGKVEIMVTGLPADAEAAWMDAGRARATHVSLEGYFDRAVARALALAGYRLLPP